MPPISLFFLSLAACHSISQSAPTEGDSLGMGGLSIWPEPDWEAAEFAKDSNEENRWLAGFGSGSGSGAASPHPGLAADSDTELPESDASLMPGSEAPPAGQLRFLRYVESETSRKLLSLTNPGIHPATDCYVELYTNGATDARRSFAVPSVDPGGTAELCFPDAFDPECSATYSGSSFNGDDALLLRCGAHAVDQFGELGMDPGSAWQGIDANGEDASTADSALFRCQAPDAPGFQLSDWASFPFELPLSSLPAKADLCPTKEETPPPGGGGATSIDAAGWAGAGG